MCVHVKKTREIHFRVSEKDYQKLLMIAGEDYTITDRMVTMIRTYYYNKFKQEDLPDMSIKQNREVIRQIQKQTDSISQSELEDAKAAFIARRNARKEGVSND